MPRRLFFVMLASLALAFFGCSRNTGATASASDLKPLTVDQVAARIAANDGKTFVFDNNSQDTWKQGHVPGAKWLDEDDVTAAALPADKTATLIFYCHNEL
jgi:hypothetical protein